MKRAWLLITGVLVFCLALDVPVWAQYGPNGYNPNSVRGAEKSRRIFGQPIFESDIMYRTTVWRIINLREKKNKPFFSIENEITQVIIDAVKEIGRASCRERV